LDVGHRRGAGQEGKKNRVLQHGCVRERRKLGAAGSKAIGHRAFQPDVKEDLHKRPHGPMAPIPCAPELLVEEYETRRYHDDQLNAAEAGFYKRPQVAVTAEQDPTPDPEVNNSNHDGLEDFLGLFKDLETVADSDEKNPEPCRQSLLKASFTPTVPDEHPAFSVEVPASTHKGFEAPSEVLETSATHSEDEDFLDSYLQLHFEPLIARSLPHHLVSM